MGRTASRSVAEPDPPRYPGCSHAAAEFPVGTVTGGNLPWLASLPSHHVADGEGAMQNLNMPARILTALYDARGAVERARDELLALGVSRDDVTLRGTGPQATTEPATGERSFWEDIGAALLPAR